MQVYIELAVLENFCMDFTLLYSAKLASKNSAHILRIALGSALGACFAVVFPLLNIGTGWQ
ncbi:MAG: sigma-E processing peptidase SpoIIGA, partial [Clostridia bacterium]|nr:sigma-E processing peptidase SpoIIGA [Clostridia bacterium]